ncbi:hypothetical protein BT96DRAFT_995074 [Gymnopus androsaceus JB14]|uniref:Uncharacterized protein n=1 Tax=Gymnopus androsaceus JB14 TaxID=1447944 RepID=A0A6A4HJA2_9AGAR|nr:hypothetical protein BT96DRAFT_995074 [Gymnopus androsaceus JB14]
MKAVEEHVDDLNHAQKAQKPVIKAVSREASVKALALRSSKSASVGQSQPSASKAHSTQPSGPSASSKADSGGSIIPGPKVPKDLEEFLQHFTDNEDTLGYLQALMNINKASDNGVKIKKEKEKTNEEAILHPKGEAGDGKHGFNLAEAVGLGGNNAEKGELYTHGI